ncbi:MAG: hypothetical protein RJB24_576, partial [Candidatus Parcubacteria bacterium]
MSKVKKSKSSPKQPVISIPDLVPDIDPNKIKESSFNFIREFKA